MTIILLTIILIASIYSARKYGQLGRLVSAYCMGIGAVFAALSLLANLF